MEDNVADETSSCCPPCSELAASRPQVTPIDSSAVVERTEPDIKCSSRESSISDTRTNLWSEVGQAETLVPSRSSH